MLKDHFSVGLSYESFAGVAGVAVDTLYEWEKVHPEFSEAKKEFRPLAQLFYEKAGAHGMMGKVNGFIPSVWVFNMKNRFSWHDNIKVQSLADPEDNSKNKVIEKLSEQLAAMKSFANGLE